MNKKGDCSKKKNSNVLTEKQCSAILEEIKQKLPDVSGRNNNINDVIVNLDELATSDGAQENDDREREVYENLQKTTASQIDLIKEILAQLERINRSNYEKSLMSKTRRCSLMELLSIRAINLPLYARTGDEVYPPPYVGAMRVPDTDPLEVGDSAASYDGEQWILADVIAKLPLNRYKMYDIDADLNTSFLQDREYLIPLPKWRADPEHDPHAVFPKNAIVLGVFPQSSVFYKGIVYKVPSNSTDDYTIFFENEPHEGEGYSKNAQKVPQRHVIWYKDVSNSKEEQVTNKRKYKKRKK